MIDRIAVMLNYYVIELASTKCQEIQVKASASCPRLVDEALANPKLDTSSLFALFARLRLGGGWQVWDPAKYNFTPKEWLKRIVEIYLNFGQHKAFKEAVQRDGRSFKPEAFRRIVALLKDQMILSLVRPTLRYFYVLLFLFVILIDFDYICFSLSCFLSFRVRAAGHRALRRVRRGGGCLPRPGAEDAGGDGRDPRRVPRYFLQPGVCVCGPVR
jgi:hypothetical protein